jgi:hypothetical protein
MKFNPQETEFLTKYGTATGWATFNYYDLTRQEQAIAKTFQIRNLLVYAQGGMSYYKWTEYGRRVAGESEGGLDDTDRP